MKVFLGGTCNGSLWREKLMPELDKHNIHYFNPVVEDWTPDCQINETYQKSIFCDVHLYVITPLMKGVFSIAELIESCYITGKKVVFCYLESDGDSTFDKHQIKSLEATKEMVQRHGGIVCDSLDDVVTKLTVMKTNVDFIIENESTCFGLVNSNTKNVDTLFPSQIENIVSKVNHKQRPYLLITYRQTKASKLSFVECDSIFIKKQEVE